MEPPKTNRAWSAATGAVSDSISIVVGVGFHDMSTFAFGDSHTHQSGVAGATLNHVNLSPVEGETGNKEGKEREEGRWEGDELTLIR